MHLKIHLFALQLILCLILLLLSFSLFLQFYFFIINIKRFVLRFMSCFSFSNSKLSTSFLNFHIFYLILPNYSLILTFYLNYYYLLLLNYLFSLTITLLSVTINLLFIINLFYNRTYII